MTEKELEKLFRNKLQSRDLPFNMANWKAMENLLDEKDSPTGFFYWRAVAAVLIFALLVVPIIYFAPAPQVLEAKNFDMAGSEGKWQAPAKLQEGPTQNNGSVFRNSIATEEELLRENTEDVPGRVASRPVKENGMPGTTPSPQSASARYAAADFEAPAGIDQNAALSGENESYVWLKAKSIGVMQGESQLMSKKTLAHFSPEAFGKFQKQHEWWATAGTVMSNSHSSATPGLGWYAGFAYQFRLSEKWLLNTGLDYSRQNRLGITQVSDSTFYHFGQERVTTEDKSERLEYLTLPLHASFQPGARHEFGAGGYAARLLRVSQVVERTSVHSQKPAETEVATLSDFDDRFEEFDFGLDVFYRYHFSPWLSVGVQVRQGLTDITRDVNEEFSENHQNLNTRITLRYRIF